jgi:hypothetical protein
VIDMNRRHPSCAWCSAFTADYLRTGITVDGGQIDARASGHAARPYHPVVLQALRSVVQPMTSLLIALMLDGAGIPGPLPGKAHGAGCQDRNDRRRHRCIRGGCGDGLPLA